MDRATITYRFTQISGSDKRPEMRGEHRENERERDEAMNIIPLNRDESRVEAETRPETKQDTQLKENGDSLFDHDSLNPFTTDFAAWKSPFDKSQFNIENETDRVERIIRETADANGETGYYGFETNEPDETESGREFAAQPYDRIRSNRHLRPTRPSWVKMIFSVAGAIATGGLFGYFVLSLFSDDNVPVPMTAANLLKLPNFSVADKTSVTDRTADASKPQAGAVNSGKDQPAVPATANLSGSLQTNIPAKTYTMLQTGVFSNLQGARSAQTELQKKGIPSVAESGDKIFVYSGIAANRSDALALSQKLQQNKMEVYPKAYTLPAVGKMVWNGPPSRAAESYMDQGDKLIRSLSELTMKHLTESTPQPLDQSALQSIKQAHQSFSAAGAAMNDGLAAEAKNIVLNMNNAMNTAVLSIEQYGKNPMASYLWQAQQALLQFALAEKELLSAIAVQ